MVKNGYLIASGRISCGQYPHGSNFEARKTAKNLKQKNLRCFTGACPEIYLEKSFKKLNDFNQVRLKNCKILGETSIALDINHTLKESQHKKNLISPSSSTTNRV